MDDMAKITAGEQQMTDVTDASINGRKIADQFWLDTHSKSKLARMIDQRSEASIAPYVEALREARAYVDTHQPDNQAAELLAQIDALLTDTKGEG